MRSVLILIDLQHDFLGARELEPAAGEIVESATTLLRAARDFAVPVFHVRTTIERPGDAMPHWRPPAEPRCVPGTAGHETPESLAAFDGDPIFDKTGYSAFGSHGFDDALRERRVDTLVLCGVHLHACVRSTALDAHEAGYRVLVADDAVGSDDPVHASITRRYLRDRCIGISNVRDIVRSLESSKWTPDDTGSRAAAASVAETRCSRSAAAFATWSSISWSNRRLRLERFADNLEQASEEIVARIVSDIRKPIRDTRREVAAAVAMVRHTISRTECPATTLVKPGRSFRRRPLGPIALVTPWNNPAFIPIGKLTPALLFGNTVVWKPAEATEAIAQLILEQFPQEPGEAVLQLIEGGSRTSESLMRDPRISAVSLTGSLRAGRSAQEICARRGIPLQAELGGNNGAIVWHDTDVPTAAAKVAAGAFSLAGQRCTANRRVIVDEEIFEPFLEHLLGSTRKLLVGSPEDETTQIGPLVSDHAFDRVQAQIGRAAARGCQLFTPHEVASSRSSASICPTLILCEDPASEIVQEETFGPVLVVQRASSWEQALEYLNGVRQGLAAALFSDSARRRQDFLSRAEAGILKFDESTAEADFELPFGGWKASGSGPPEHGNGDVEFYTRYQAIYGDSPTTTPDESPPSARRDEAGL